MEEIIKKHNKLKGHIKDPSKLIELINTVVNEAQEEGLFNLQKGGDVEEELCEEMSKLSISDKCSWHDKDFRFECKPPLKDLFKQVEYIEKLPQPEQRTPEWYKMRDQRVTASVAGAIVGMNPHQSRDDTLRDKLGLGKPFSGFVATEHGTRMEEIATMLYEIETGKPVTEFGLVPHPYIPFIGASPDGITRDGIMLEIKCPKTRAIKTTGTLEDVPKYYWAQMQMQLEVCMLEVCDFLQCKLYEYISKEEFVGDLSNKKTKCGYLYMWDTMYKKPAYIYPKADMFTKNLKTEEEQREYMKKLDKWAKDEIEKSDKERYKNHYMIWWRIDKYACLAVQRDREWFSKSYPIFEKFWEDVVYYRKYPEELPKYKKNDKVTTGDLNFTVCVI